MSTFDRLFDCMREGRLTRNDMRKISLALSENIEERIAELEKENERLTLSPQLAEQLLDRERKNKK